MNINEPEVNEPKANELNEKVNINEPKSKELKWDGTFLNFTLKERDKENGIKYGKVIEYNVNCIYIVSRSKLPVIYDLLKPLFGIRSTGCHYNDKYIIYKPYEKQNGCDSMWYKEIRLSDFNHYSNFKYSMVRDIRNIICFRYFLFLTHISEKNILYRDTYVVSYDDKKGQTNTKVYSIPETLRKKWFLEFSIDEVICMLFKKYRDTINCELRHIIKEIIKKVDRKYIHIATEFCDRLTDIFDSTNVKTKELSGELEFFEAQTSRDYTL